MNRKETCSSAATGTDISDNVLYLNKKGKFEDISHAAWVADYRGAMGLAAGDWNSDGDLDFVIVIHAEGVQLFRNEGMTSPTPKEVAPSTEVRVKDKGRGNWVILLLRSRSGRDGALNGHGEGARLIEHVNGHRLRRNVGGASYLSQSSRRVHFGPGSALQIDSSEVYWLGGGKDIYNNLRANSYWELKEGDPIPQRLVFAKNSKLDERQRVSAFWPDGTKETWQKPIPMKYTTLIKGAVNKKEGQ